MRTDSKPPSAALGFASTQVRPSATPPSVSSKLRSSSLRPASSAAGVEGQCVAQRLDRDLIQVAIMHPQLFAITDQQLVVGLVVSPAELAGTRKRHGAAGVLRLAAGLRSHLLLEARTAGLRRFDERPQLLDAAGRRGATSGANITHAAASTARRSNSCSFLSHGRKHFAPARCVHRRYQTRPFHLFDQARSAVVADAQMTLHQ
jgi:hypothetical protein